MYCKFVYMLILFCLLRYRVFGMPLISSIFKGLVNEANKDSEKEESNKLHASLAPDTIDLSIYGRSLYRQPDLNYTGSLVAKLKQNENSVNPEELGSYLEGDILVPQKPLILKNGLSSRAYLWPNGEVPFEIAGDFEINHLNIIAFAMDEYHAKTCIRFKPRTRERDYISIVSGNSGCWTVIGRLGGKQEVNLQAPGCLRKPGTSIHELMHVLGFFHEHNRKERDSYVNIQMQNIKKYAVSNFRKISNTISFGVGYDYGSVMHYSPKAFSSNGQPTIVAKRPIDKTLMGQRKGFSPLDIEKVNRMYNCKVNVKSVAPPVKLQKQTPSRFYFAQRFANNLFRNLSNRFVSSGFWQNQDIRL